MSDPGITPNDGSDEFRDDDVDTEHVGPVEFDDREEALETVTNDAVAGETVEPQLGDGTDDGPTGGASREGAPDMFEHDSDEDGRNLATEDGSGPL
ncbi:hypothetical protein [Curtobacterium sp. ISL-83]|uniref:hypothetical protein n=1 Tax=Curtobacterium sp. ISL-83 TaxID=2819145 RepID=UPI001BED2B06|nr:hypothetical protein [Curtobacterium sp. ISL-83]MBT2501871.1 hypothetical protein [Curtobacterium sp. ISL-83]